jgi:hypothetical protein
MYEITDGEPPLIRWSIELQQIRQLVRFCEPGVHDAATPKSLAIPNPEL